MNNPTMWAWESSLVPEVASYICVSEECLLTSRDVLSQYGNNRVNNTHALFSGAKPIVTPYKPFIMAVQQWTILKELLQGNWVETRPRIGVDAKCCAQTQSL